MARLNKEVASPSNRLTSRPRGLLDWQWPISPKFFKIYDKYNDVEITLCTDADKWSFSVQGRMETVQFKKGREGALQRKIVTLTQRPSPPLAPYKPTGSRNRKGASSPSTVSKFIRSLLLNWPTYKELLTDGPSELKRHWTGSILTIDTAKAAKNILNLACSASLGPWRPAHLSQIKALDTRAADALLEQHGRVERREKVLPVSTQAAIVRVLDEYASMPNLSEPEAEGLAALSLTYQHGVRPVQLLSMRVEDVNVLRDATGAPVCIVSFHAAKQGEGREFEMVRQVKFEWGSLIEQLLAHAKRARRRRLFSTSMSEKLWFRVKAVCKQKGLIVQFNANSLRHNGAQQLADAGQSRASIQNFLGHSGSSAANAYLKGSRQQSNLLNTALGTSKLYGNILSLAEGNFVSNEEIAQASEDQQIGAVVGDRLVSGVGLCRTGQSHCPYDPVASCYGCNKYMPSLDRSAHEDAVAGMREQVLVFINRGGDVESQAYKQLTHALAGAQHAVEVVDRICGKAK